MPKLPSKEVRAARWLEFAAFMESLPETKFVHRSWCQPDHTCKTTACVAGWAAINYTEQAKNWLRLTFEYQKLEKIKKESSLNEEEYTRWYESITSAEKLNPDNYRRLDPNSWHSLGRDSLYLAENTAKVLFYPPHSFWNGIIGYATSEDIALIFRYMATFSGRLGKRFNRERMQRAIDAYASK